MEVDKVDLMQRVAEIAGWLVDEDDDVHFR